MRKLLFIPFSIAGGLVAGFAAKKLFDLAWGLIDDEEPPEPEDRDVSWLKLAAALALEGAIFRVTRGLADRGSRIGFYRLTGAWPGDEEPERGLAAGAARVRRASARGRVGVRTPLYCEHVMSEQASLTDQPALARAPPMAGTRSAARSAPGYATSPTGRSSRPCSGFESASFASAATAASGCGSSSAIAPGRVEAVDLGGTSRSRSRSPSPAPRSTSAAASESIPSTGRKITVEAIRRRPSRASSRAPTSPTGRASRWNDSRPTCASCSRRSRIRQLRELLDRFFEPGSPVWARFREAPAAKYYHQAYRTGCSTTRSRSPRR